MYYKHRQKWGVKLNLGLACRILGIANANVGLGNIVARFLVVICVFTTVEEYDRSD